MKDKVNFADKAITKTIFRRKTYPKNSLGLSTLSDGGFYVYHTFGNNNAYDGFRWFVFDFLERGENFKLDSKNRVFHYVIPYWEDEGSDGAYYAEQDVPVKIYFTPYGWKKFTKNITLFQEKINARKKRISKKRKAPVKKKTTTRKRKAPAKKKTTTRKRKAPAKKKTATKRKASSVRKKLSQRKKAPKKSARILRGKRNSPSTSATSVSVGTKRRGGDGKMYVCKTYKRGNKRVKRWFKV